MSKKTTVKHIALTIACAAVLAACGGGGGGSTSTDLVDNAVAARNVMNMIEALDEAAEITLEDKASVEAAAQSYNRLSDSQKSLISKEQKDKLEAALNALAAASAGTSTDGSSTVDTSEISDNNSLAPLNLPTPLHTSFISSTGAQQHNPHLQLRTVDDEPTFVDSQIGLIRTLVLNKNDQVVLDGAVLTNSAESPATQVNYRTPNSSITKYTSAGSTLEDIAPLFGKEKGVYSEVKTTLDEGIKSDYTKLDEAWKIIKDPEADPKAIAEAKKVVQNLRPTYTSDFKYDYALELAKKEQEKFTEQGMKDALDKLKDQYNKNMQDAGELASAWEKYNNNGDSEAWSVIEKYEPKLTDQMLLRVVLDANSNNAIDGMPASAAKTLDAVEGIAYVQKDKDKLAFDKKFDGVYVIKFANGVRITLHDPAAAGWTYQTFAHYVDMNNNISHAYQSVGNETPVADMPTSGTATYTGITTAYLVEKDKADRQLTADVKAVADFAKKGLRFETSNAHFHDLTNGVRKSEEASGYNMKGSASWSANSNSFTGTAATADNQMTGRLLGKFYGAQAAEIGGTYGLKNDGNTKQLIGGYGAKRP
ncbi:hypothetical protein BWD09_01650 [Neisseria dentiae]|uniref:Transferrin-binding protein B C-lobe/N-lobe beta-barrel domain-containing protein n=1 Tax=Neisseria dentiae TaxID=194197 RepID=A0A1X3DFK4_9NEIS|nr:transferrin-binding protein-like solute binding protein [Neisseria dentiae]OSI18501.1 hypothetical protein BWD09_01650 [Neisseria dentiae]QMT45611.1 transferrin-binding protein-like solute binding protein [Neisseria dentiae]STZ51529.1 Transferrin binding protein-like solute binding protein [Neisseria dentiae]